MPPSRRSGQFALSQSSAAVCSPKVSSGPGTPAAGPALPVADLATGLAGVLDDTGAWDGGLAAARAEIDRLLGAVAACQAELVLVSAEVGLGVVPETRSGRLFRDELGVLNAALA